MPNQELESEGMFAKIKAKLIAVLFKNKLKEAMQKIPAGARRAIAVLLIILLSWATLKYNWVPRDVAIEVVKELHEIEQEAAVEEAKEKREELDVTPVPEPIAIPQEPTVYPGRVVPLTK